MLSKVIEAKKAGKEVYTLVLLDGAVYFSLLPWKDYKTYREISKISPGDIPDLEEEIFKQAVIHTSYTDEYKEAHAGIITLVSRTIMKLSGSSSIGDYNLSLELARRRLTEDADKGIMALIASIFHYTPQQIEQLTWQEISLLLAQSELITGNPLQYKDNTFTQEDLKKDQIDFDKESKEYTKFDYGPGEGDHKLKMNSLREQYFSERDGRRTKPK